MRKPAEKKPIDPKVRVRLDALEHLIDNEYGGKPSVFEEKTGVKMAQVNQWFSGYRALRDKALKTLIEKTGKDEAYFEASPLSDEDKEVQLKVAQLTTLLRALPKESRDAAYLAAVEVLIKHLPASQQTL